MARVGIVGGGIIGSAIATWLVTDGHEVTVHERDIEGLPASTGNAALLAIREIDPIAMPTTLLSVPRWMMDPNGPLALRPSDLPRFIPWLLAFTASARPSRIEAARKALAFLLRRALPAHEELERRAGIPRYIRHTGSLTIYDHPSGLDAARESAAHVKALLGHETEELTPAEARRYAPALEGPFAGATLAPEYRMATHPLTVLRGLQAFVRERGRIKTGVVERIEASEAGPLIVGADGSTDTYDIVVVAAGVWSRDIVRRLGLKVLLEAERGYNTTFPGMPIDLPLPVFFGDHAFVASPLEGALRIGGAVELASPDAPPNPTRARGMLDKMRRYVPSLPHEGGVEWMGRRPSTPDSLPVIGPHPRDRRIVFAFGHGHLGLTLSAATARVVADAIGSDWSDPDLAPFSITRFQQPAT